MRFDLFLNRRWWKTTLLVLAAAAVMIRLGIWQLDRLAQRKAFNQRVETQLAQPALDFNSADPGSDLYNMEYRYAHLSGTYDPTNQVALRNQDWQGNLGVHLLTPLIIEGSDQAVLVDRGWVPYEDFEQGDFDKYDQPGLVNVGGIMRRSQAKPRIGGRADQVPGPGEPALNAWYWINLEQINRQMPYKLLPVYIQENPGSATERLPYKASLELDLSEGPHLGYAFQWFIFAAILAIGYPVYIKREESRVNNQKAAGSPYIQSEKSRTIYGESDKKDYKNA